MRLARFAFLVLVVVAPMLVEAATPIEAFTAIPKYDSLAISPGGKRLALTQHEGATSLLTIVEYPSMKPFISASFGNRTDIQDIRWVDEKRLLITPSRYFPEFKAYKVYTGELIRVDVDSGKAEVIFGQFADQRNAGTHVEKRDAVHNAGRILSTKTDDPDEVLVETTAYGIGADANAVYKMNLKNGRLNTVASSGLPGSRFVAGANHRVSVNYGVNSSGKTVVYYLPARDKPGCCNWNLKVTTDSETGLFYPVAWTGKGEEFYAMDGRDARTRGVAVWNAETNAIRTLYRHPEADPYPASFDLDGRPWLYAGTDDRPIYWYPDPDHPLARMHRTLANALPQDYVSVESHTADLSVAVVRINSARRPPTFLVVDVATSKPVQMIATYPNLAAQNLSPVTPIEFAARDGLRIRGYVTTPVGADGKPGRKLPTVVVVHGGPHGIYDDFSYDFERQLFASRGYAVLQVNYRGSGGRGREFERAGYGKWGREMQDDVTDGVRWAIQDGVADASRICIYGASYGAFSALVGVAREPTMFKCAIGMAGVYDLPLMYEKGDIQFYARGVSYLKEALGEDMDDLRARSPVNNAKAIQAKVMLLHGTDDDRAPLEHAERMRKALIEAGNPPEWIVKGSEDHGFFNPANRLDAYTRMLGFIDRNIGH